MKRFLEYFSFMFVSQIAGLSIYVLWCSSKSFEEIMGDLHPEFEPNILVFCIVAPVTLLIYFFEKISKKNILQKVAFIGIPLLFLITLVLIEIFHEKHKLILLGN